LLLKVLYITPRTHVTLLMLLLLFLNQISEDRKQEVLIRKKKSVQCWILVRC